MAESKLVQLNLEKIASHRVYSSYNIYVFNMLSLGHILILDLVVANLFMHSLPGMYLAKLTLKVFCMRLYYC